jgi:hypothetical protein
MRYKLFIITFVAYVFILNNDDKLQTCHHHLVLEFFGFRITHDLVSIFINATYICIFFNWDLIEINNLIMKTCK